MKFGKTMLNSRVNHTENVLIVFQTEKKIKYTCISYFLCHRYIWYFWGSCPSQWLI